MRNCRESSILTAVAFLLATLTHTTVAQSGQNDPGISANELVRAVVANELKLNNSDHSRWMYEVKKMEGDREQTKEVVQTRDGALERLVAVNGRSLSVEKQREEKERIDKLINDPQELQKLEQTRKKDAGQCETFFRMIPEAFTFSYVEREGDLVRLKFRPNPDFQPPSREARVFHSMVGEMLVDGKEQRLATITGELTEDVKFGGGLLGHLDRGGYFRVERKNIGSGHWELTNMEVNMNGKALFLKTIAVKEKEFRDRFRRVAEGLSLAEAAEMLDSHFVLAARK